MIQNRPSLLERAFQIYAEQLQLKEAEWVQLHNQIQPLTSQLHQHIPITKIIPIGAMARKTAPSPVGCATLAVVLDPSLTEQFRSTEQGPKNALESLKSTLLKVSPDTPIHIRTSSILLGGNVLSLRLIPAFERSDGGLDLVDIKNQGWRSVYLSRQKAYLDTNMQYMDGKTQSLLRILHAWSQHNHLALHTHHLEIMALNSLSKSPPTLAIGFLKILQKLPNAVYEPCLNPCNHKGPPLSGYLDDKLGLREETSEAAYRSALELVRAIDMDAPGNTGHWALSLARSVFGHSFPSITELSLPDQAIL